MIQALPDFAILMPELILIGTALALILVGAVRGEKATGFIEKLGVLALAASALSVLWLARTHEAASTFNGSFVLDAFAAYFKIACFGGAAIALAMAPAYFAREGNRKFEYPILVLLCSTGMGLMISAHDFITLYLGLELQSLSIYVLAAMRRENAKSAEAGLKYFVLGALSSGMLLYGISLIYGFTGSVEFSSVSAVLTGKPAPLGIIFGLVFLLAGFAFKLSAVPFHMWAPDVYEGAPTPVTAFIASAPKIAATAMLARPMFEAFGGIAPAWQQIITFISIASMLLGAFAAIGQRNIKRLLAYSSIGHMGYMLVGLAGANVEGVQGMLVYMAIYMLMTLGGFALVLAMRTKDGLIENVDDLAGLAKTQPLAAFFFAMLLFSMAGIPPLAGFFAKYFVFMAAIKANLIALAVIGVVTSVIGAYYYLRIIKLMYFDEARVAFEPMQSELKLVLYASGLFTLGYIFYPAPLITAAAAAARSLF